MDIHSAFRQGARQLARDNARYTTLHKAHGIDESEWILLTQPEYWTPDQARQMRTVIAAVLEVSMTIAGMPAIPLPGQYAAALIAEVVAPVNRFLACMYTPDTFNAVDASGLMGTHEVKPMSREQLMALTLAYSGGYGEEPVSQRLPDDVARQIERENEVSK